MAPGKINALLTGRRRRPDNPSADTQIAEARRERAAERARGAAPPEAGRPSRPTPSFLKRGAPTLLDGVVRELSGGAGAPASRNRRVIPDNPSADTQIAEARRERAAERAGLGDNPPPGRTRSGDAAGMSSPTFGDRSQDPAQRAFEEMMDIPESPEKDRGRLIEEELKRARGLPPYAIPTLNMAENRIASIKQDTEASFDIADNPRADGGAPIYRQHSVGAAAVAEFDRIIEREAGGQGVDPDLVRAIMYVENADGKNYGADEALEWIGLARTIKPMSVHQEIWAGIGGISREELHRDELNVRAAVIILARIIERLDDPTPAKIATIYNSTAKEKVSGYGERVRRALETRAWE